MGEAPIDPSIIQLLKSSHLFGDADDAVLNLVASQLKAFSYKKGEPIILENEISDQVYFIKTGAVEITKYRPELQQVTRVAMLLPGSHFSEFSVINHSYKSASAFAFEDTELYQMLGDTFLKILLKTPALSYNLAMILADLNLNFSQSHTYIEYFDPASISVSSEIASFFPPNLWKKFGALPLRYYTNNILFAAKDPYRTEFSQFCQTQLAKIQVNVVLIGEEDFELTEKKLKLLYAGGPSKTKKSIEKFEEEDIKTSLTKSHYFDSMNPQVFEQLAGVAEKVTYQAGEIIYSPGEVSETFYLVQSGSVELSKQINSSSNYCQLIGIGQRQSLSEVSLLTNTPHSHIARASQTTNIIKLKKNVFMQLLKSGAFCLNVSKVLAKRLEFVTRFSGVKFDTNREAPKMQDALKILSKEVMLEHQLIPLKVNNEEVTLGVVNPNSESICFVAARYLRGYRINLEAIPFENFKKWMSLGEAVMASNGLPLNTKNISMAKTEGTVFELNRILVEGYDSRASDVHFEPSNDGYCVRYRIDGVMMEVANKIPKEIGIELVSRVKVLSQLDIANHMVPQDGQLKLVAGDTHITARVSTVPTKHGENAVLRLIRNRSSTQPLSMLVPDIYSIKILKAIARAKQGLFLVTGPTGSGKTTTLYSLIAELNHVDVKIISLEDPVELEIPGTTQIEINEKSGMSFAKALKSTLRQDPDVVMVGEIRDEESAKIVFEAAMSGHLVISTLHTNSSFGIRNRLHDLGIPAGVAASGIIGAMAQRLARALCKKCSRLRPTTAIEKEFFAKRLGPNQVPLELKAAVGCSACNETGYLGRIPIIEIWKKTREIEELISSNAKTEDLIHAAKKSGYISIEDFGLKMVLCGLTSIEEAERVTAGYT